MFDREAVGIFAEPRGYKYWMPSASGVILICVI